MCIGEGEGILRLHQVLLKVLLCVFKTGAQDRTEVKVRLLLCSLCSFYPC